MDVFSLGLLFAYVLSGGVHAFGSDKEERVFSIKKKKPMSLTVDQFKGVLRAAEVFDLIRLMVSYNPSKRPSATAVVNHTFFGQSTVNEPVASVPFALNGKRCLLDSFQVSQLLHYYSLIGTTGYVTAQGETRDEAVVFLHQMTTATLQDTNNSSPVSKRSLDEISQNEQNTEVLPKKSRQDESVQQMLSTSTEPQTVKSPTTSPISSSSPTSTLLIDQTSPLNLRLSSPLPVDQQSQLTSPRLSNLLLSCVNRR